MLYVIDEQLSATMDEDRKEGSQHAGTWAA
jgi:hypothetical protein